MRILVALIACVLLVACSTPPGTSPDAPPTRTGEQWTMPDLVGSNLQQAQDQMQKITGNDLFITRSHDATGQDRNQIDDSDWKVCSQNIPAGAAINRDSVIDFGAVKQAETCP